MFSQPSSCAHPFRLLSSSFGYTELCADLCCLGLWMECQRQKALWGSLYWVGLNDIQLLTFKYLIYRNGNFIWLKLMHTTHFKFVAPSLRKSTWSFSYFIMKNLKQMLRGHCNQPTLIQLSTLSGSISSPTSLGFCLFVCFCWSISKQVLDLKSLHLYFVYLCVQF